MRKSRFSSIGAVIAVAAAFLMTCGVAKTAKAELTEGQMINNVWISDNEHGNDYLFFGTAYNFTTPEYSNLTQLSNGNFMRVEYGSDGKVHVEYYDSTLKYLSSKTVTPELSKFGGFYTDGTYYYLVTGTRTRHLVNTAAKGQEDVDANVESLSKLETIRVTKYDSNWKKICHKSIIGANTTDPFDAGCCRMADDGTYLYINTCHEMYPIWGSYVEVHQSNMLFILKLSDLSMVYDGSRYGVNYVSHSFNQYIRIDGSTMYTLDHGDAYPRSAYLQVFSLNNTSGLDSWTPGRGYKANGVTLMEYTYDDTNEDTIAATGHSNVTNAKLGGLEYTTDNVITAGASTPQASFYSKSPMNVYYTVTGKNTISPYNTSGASTTIKWLTNYSSTKDRNVRTPQLVKISDSRIMILWSETVNETGVTTLYWNYIKNDGTTESATNYSYASTETMVPSTSDCQPLYDAKGNRILWYVTDTAMDFCGITLSDNQYFEVNIEKRILATDMEIPSTLSIKEGKTYTMVPKIIPENTTDAVTFTYGTSRDDYLTISDKGVITPIQDGYTYVYVYAYRNEEYLWCKTCFVTIEHDYDEGTVNSVAGCTSFGSILYTCKSCGETTEEVLYPTGHNNKETQRTTNTDWGNGMHQTITDTFDVCSDCKTETFRFSNSIMEEHKWDKGVVTQAATTTKTGSKTYTCTVCKATKTETVPVLTFTSSGNGWKKVGTNWRYFRSYTAVSGWQKISGKWYYFDPANCYMVSGWKKLSGKWYYFSGDGAMKTGWLKSGGKWYYFGSDGAMKTGWQKSGGKWYFFGSDGAMKTGWQKSGGKWYYFNGDGAMKTGWLKSGGKWYFFGSDGAMKTGWLQSGGKWYYFGSDGAMKTGWLKSGGKWYYFNSDGSMVAGTTKTIGGVKYSFDKSGEMK